jgi:hypothetical protein
MNIKIALDFIESINSGDIDSIHSLMTNDHLFIDSQGNKVRDNESMRKGWIGYFEMFPDYKIEITDTFEKDSIVVLMGYASGTYKNIKNNYWRIPSAWKAIVADNKIKLWQVFADNSVPIEIINRNK